MLTIHDSPVVRLNRAVAVAGTEGPAAALAAVDAVAGLDGYPYRHAARAELLHRLGRSGEAARAWRAALDRGLPRAQAQFARARLAQIDESAPDSA